MALMPWEQLEKVTINCFNDVYWYQPSIVSYKKNNWVARPYKNLQKCLINEGLIGKEFVLISNRDLSLKIFHYFQKVKEIPVFLNKEQLKTIEEDGYYDYRLKQSKVILRYDKKGVRLLKSGIIPYVSITWFKKKYMPSKELVILYWRSNGWTQTKSWFKFKKR